VQRGAVLLQRLLHRFHRPVHARAVAARLGQQDALGALGVDRPGTRRAGDTDVQGDGRRHAPQLTWMFRLCRSHPIGQAGSMFRPPFLARVAAGAAVYALEETRRLPSAAVKFPITAISQILQTGMHLQQFVTSLALKGDEVFHRLVPATEAQPEWATFDEDLDDEQTNGNGYASWASRFDLHTGE